jgi:hypothetical protein
VQGPVESPEQEQDYSSGNEEGRPGVIQEGSETHGTETEGKDRKEATQKDESGRRYYKYCFQAAVPGAPSGNYADTSGHRQQGPILFKGQVYKTGKEGGKRAQGKETAQEQEFNPGTGYHGCIHTYGSKEKDDKRPEMADFSYCSSGPG